MGAKEQIGRHVVPRVAQWAPGASSSFVREALHRAIDGLGPLPSARASAEAALRSADGDATKAASALVDHHVRIAGAQGLLTNIGGLVTMAVTVPANIAGLAVVQCRMVACVAHVRGYDLTDPRVHNAILVTVIGPDRVDQLVRDQRLVGPPMAIAVAPVHDPSLDLLVAAEVASDLVTRVAGRRLATTVGRRMPLVGGVVGMGVDGWSTWRIGRYAERELLPRAKR